MPSVMSLLFYIYFLKIYEYILSALITSGPYNESMGAVWRFLTHMKFKTCRIKVRSKADKNMTK